MYGLVGQGSGLGAALTGRASATVSLPDRGTSAGSTATWRRAPASHFATAGDDSRAHTELIVLVLLEAAALLYLRHAFRAHHGG